MAAEALEQFIEAANKSQELLAKCRQLVEDSHDLAGFVALGREHGFEFTSAEAQVFFQQAFGASGPTELTDRQLANLSGAGWPMSKYPAHP
jgi:hypothetical protein